MKRTLSALMAAILTALAAASCGEAAAAPPSPGTDAETAAADTAAAPEETEPEALTDGLPEMDFGGAAFNIYTRVNTSNYKMLAEEQNGDILNDAKFNRNTKIAERFNVVFSETEYTDENAPIKAVTAGDDTYSLMNVRCSASINMMLGGTCYDTSSLPYIDLSKPYWDDELSRYINIGEKNFITIGSSNLTAIDFMSGLLFNKDLAEKYGFESFYDTVRDGKWTFDRLAECAASVTEDINGDSQLNDEDQFGALSAAKFLHASFIPAANAWYIKKDENNMPVFEMDTDEYFIGVYNKILDILNDNGAWYNTSDTTNEQETYTKMFRNGQGLFFTVMFYFIAGLRDMDIDFGILPFPKYNEEQDRYYGRLCFFDAAVVPVSPPDASMSAAVLEAMSCESYNSVVPAYKDVVLKSKFTRDEDSSEMIDIIMAHRILDYGDSIYCGDIRDGFMSNLFIKTNRDIASKAASSAKKINGALEKLKEAYAAIEG